MNENFDLWNIIEKFMRITLESLVAKIFNRNYYENSKLDHQRCVALRCLLLGRCLGSGTKYCWLKWQRRLRSYAR